jgi:hypothetical protein
MKTSRPCADIVQTNLRNDVERVRCAVPRCRYGAGNWPLEGCARRRKPCTMATLQPLRARASLQHIAT